MANDFRKSQIAAKGALDAEAQLFNNGYLCIYDTTMVDGTSNALTTQSKIVQLQFGAVAFTTAAVGYPTSITATSTLSASASFSSTATWYRCYENTTTIPLCQGTVGNVAGFDLVLNAVQISSGATVSVTSFVINLPTS